MIPIENLIAFFPPSRTVGKAVLRPLTLAGAMTMELLGMPLDHTIEPGKEIFAGCILATPDEDLPELLDERLSAVRFRKFARLVKGHGKEIAEAVDFLVDKAFATVIPAMGSKKLSTPHGLGWPLEMAELLCAEYGWTFPQATSTPVATAFALAAAARQRNGGKHGGPDYIERILIAQMRST